MLSDIESFWDWDVLVILPADHKKEEKIPLHPLSSIEPPVAYSSFSESLFSGLDFLLHPGTVRALCDSCDKEVAVTKVSKRTQCHKNSVHCNLFRKTL